MAVAGDFQASVKGKFLKNIVHVAFHRIHSEIQLGGNLFIAEPLGNEFNDFSLAPRHFDGLERVPFAGARDMLGDLRKKGRCQHCGHDLCSPGHLPYRMKELRKCRVLQNKAVYARHDVIHKRGLDWRQVHDNDPGSGASLPDGLDEPQAGPAPKDEVKQDDIDFYEHGAQRIAVAEAAYDGDVGLFPEHSAQTLPQEAIILNDGDANALHLPKAKMEESVTSGPQNTQR